MVAFSRMLKPTDVRSRFSWPSGKLHLLPFGIWHRHRLSFSALDATGKAWRFTCCVRTRGRYPKPALTASSWLPFVRAKGLGVGDLVAFYYDPAVAGYGVRVRKLIRTIKLMGVYITCYADEE